MAEKKLVRNVVVDGKLYGPDGATPTAEVLEEITNPYAFAPAESTSILTGVGASEVEEARGQGATKDAGADAGGQPDANAGINASGSASTPTDASTGGGDSGSGDGDGDASDTELKGAALDKALEDAGLSKSGTVAQKRARLQDASTGS